MHVTVIVGLGAVARLCESHGRRFAHRIQGDGNRGTDWAEVRAPRSAFWRIVPSKVCTGLPSDRS
jgi:hypothetical protein